MSKLFIKAIKHILIKMIQYMYMYSITLYNISEILDVHHNSVQLINNHFYQYVRSKNKKPLTVILFYMAQNGYYCENNDKSKTLGKRCV